MQFHMMKFSDGNVWITNDSLYYYRLMQKTEEERREIVDKYINNDDRKRTEEFMSSFGGKVDSPEVIALWSAGWNGGGNFDLISTTEQSSEVLKKLYEEMQKGNVAISSDYSFMFKDRGFIFCIIRPTNQTRFNDERICGSQRGIR